MPNSPAHRHRRGGVKQYETWGHPKMDDLIVGNRWHRISNVPKGTIMLQGKLATPGEEQMTRVKGGGVGKGENKKQNKTRQ